MPVESPSHPVRSPALAAPGLALAQIDRLLESVENRWVLEQPDLGELTRVLRTYVGEGGKRLRPAFCAWGAIGAGAAPNTPQLIDACVALELLHAFALIHDDVMDGSASRR